jgi:hypothetical protein
MNYQSKNPAGEVITFTREDIKTQNDFVWHLNNGEAVFPPRNYFVDSVSKEMFAVMDDWGTYPSENAMSALREVIGHIFDTVEGRVEAKAYICPLDCGVGKTTAMKFSLKHLVKWGYDAGSLLLFHKIDEAEATYADFVEMFGADQVGLLTSERSTENYTDKNILIITQQRFCSKMVSDKNLGTPHYNNIDLFKLNGTPRALRFWDERLNPAVSYTLDTLQLTQVAGACKDGSVGSALFDYAVFLKSRIASQSGAVSIDFKDFGLTSLDLNDSLDPNAKEAFLAFQGQTSSALSTNQEGREAGFKHTKEVLMTYKVEVPADAGVFPLLVLDASFRVNQVAYEKMAQQLPVELDNIIGGGYRKTYKKMTINWWDIGTGKDSWDVRKGVQKRNKLLQGIGQAVCSTKGRTLIICGLKELPLIRDNLVVPCDVPQPAFLTWGRHTATNEYKDIDNVVITHLFNKPSYHYIAEVRAYLGLPAETPVDGEEVKNYSRGDVWDCLYQASLRGTARQLDGDACKEMSLWVFASSKTPNVLLKDAWEALFPDATVQKVSFDFDATAFTGTAGKCLAMVKEFVAGNDHEVIIDDAYLESAGLTKDKLKDLRRKNKDLMAELATVGAIFETRGKARGQKVYLVRQEGFTVVS